MVGRIFVKKKKKKPVDVEKQFTKEREVKRRRSISGIRDVKRGLSPKDPAREELRQKQLREDPVFAADVRQKEIEAIAKRSFEIGEEKKRLGKEKFEEGRVEETQPTQPTQPDPSQEIIGTLPQTFTDVRGIETTINVPITKQQFEEARTRGVGDFLGAASLGVSPLMGKIGAGIVTSGGTKKAVQLGIKQQETVMKTIKVNRIRQLFGASEKQAEAIVASQSITKAVDLVGKARGLSKVTKALIVGGTVFTTTLGIQVMQFWASVDNVAGLASLDALTLSNEVKFTDIPNEIVATEMNRINAQLNFARSAVNTAVWINPLTGWALGKFYKRVVESTQDSVNFKFDNINRARGT